MSVLIHPTAIIDPKAQIGADVSIGAYSVIHGDVIIHDRVKIHSHVVIENGTEIGEDSEIFPFAILGTAPQHMKYKGERSLLIIGKRSIIREHVTMHRGTEVGIMKTIVGDDGLFMVGTHIAHDCIIGNNVIMANSVGLGGHTEVGDFVTIGGYAAVHQFVRIGDFAMIGGKATVVGDVIPYGIVSGERATLSGLNLVGLKRRGFDKEVISQLRATYKELFDGRGTFDERLEAVGQRADIQSAQQLYEFIKSGNGRPLCHPDVK